MKLLEQLAYRMANVVTFRSTCCIGSLYA